MSKLNLKSYSYDVARALGRQGRPRGDVFFGVELEFDVKDWDELYYDDEAPWDREPLLSDYYRPDESCWHNYNWNGPQNRKWCEECKREAHEHFEHEHKEWEKWNARQANPNTFVHLVKYPLRAMPDFCVLKEDGSVNGVEIVTAPASLRLHRNRWEPFFKELPKEFLPNTNCGLHIHLSRAPLTTDQQWAINEFINCDENEEFILKVAGRDYRKHQYCGKKRKSKDEMKRAFDNHHDAVSVSEKKPTLEVRIFASTRDYKTFITRLEFVAALTHFVQNGKWTDKSLKVSDLQTFVRSYALTYPQFSEFMKEVI